MNTSRIRDTTKGENAVHALIAFSGTVVDPDAPPVTYRESMLNGSTDSHSPEKFEGITKFLLLPRNIKQDLISPWFTPCTGTILG